MVEPFVSRSMEIFDIEDPTKASNSQHRIFRISCISTPFKFNIKQTMSNGDRQMTTTACNDDERAMLCNNDPIFVTTIQTALEKRPSGLCFSEFHLIAFCPLNLLKDDCVVSQPPNVSTDIQLASLPHHHYKPSPLHCYIFGCQKPS
ncbi:hypothetical protein CEXT_710061 [Caerostris extrusa]|uniref:Uncharacterized protein n=1 Tax=Caerostris extrusa TaxID=172846 RepID=A0AAV4VU08_CAEEX|nr:hypothetical protein CEXT_710061 [Caerostris extrusa]